MKNTNEGQYSKRIIPSNAILSGNKIQIQELIQNVARQYNITIEDAAGALENVMKTLSGGVKPD